MRNRHNERGSVFFVIFGVLAMLLVVTMTTSDFIRGPLKTATTVNRQNVAETQLQMAAKIAAQAAVNQPGAGDCDADTFIEPVPYKDAAGAPAPVGGGLIPDTMATPKRDPWNTDYGYCVWDHGADIDDAGCGGASQLRLSGTNVPIWSTLSIISAGPDKTFQTSCNDWVDANANGQPDTPLVNKPTGSDDIILDWTYTQASAAATVPPIAGGANLWIEETPGGKIRYDADNVGIGVSDPPSKLSVSGEVKIASSGASCVSAIEGAVRYDSTTKVMRYCDGSQWRSMISTQLNQPPTAPPGTGYFVLTQTTYNGNRGGLAGANANCLTELTTNTNWRGYTSALAAGQLTSSNVSAFLCASGICQNPIPAATYTFARVGDGSAGGATFVADASGLGPGDTSNWAAANYFSGNFEYLTGRAAGGSTTLFPNTEEFSCNSWTGSSAGESVRAGSSNTVNQSRWSVNNPANNCGQTRRLICMVSPPSAGGCGGSGSFASHQSATLTVPAGCKVQFKSWGAGGGSGGGRSGIAGSQFGGGGGYASITLEPSATTTFYLTVGGGGQGGGLSSDGPPFGGAGGAGAASFTGGAGGASVQNQGGGGGGGGGATTICLNNHCGVGGAVIVSVAGGGGGGGGNRDVNNGGHLDGAPGDPGGVGPFRNMNSIGVTGAPNSGGSNGGGGGGCDDINCTGARGGGTDRTSPRGAGGGGSNYVATTLSGVSILTSGTAAGSGQTAGNSGDPNRPGNAGRGAIRAIPGQPGDPGAIWYNIY